MDSTSGKKKPRLKAKRRARLPKEPFKNIGLSMSGGGFRATAFHLGVLTYLSTRKYNGVSLLERVRILSTVSAGTFAGVKYAATIKRGGSILDCFKQIYNFITTFDLVEETLVYLADDNNWKEGSRHRSLINSFAAMYHREFEHETFGLLFKPEPEIHLKEINFNATEFNFGLPFRFQKSEISNYPGRTLVHDYTGNKKIIIPNEVAKEVRLADIMAASSCFPFGFEPINFPDDFIHPEAVHLKDRSLLPKTVYDGDKIRYPIGLMDGGIDDNQGVEAVIHAEERMRHYPDELRKFISDDKKTVDLYILSDGSNPNMDSYIPNTSDKLKIIGNWNFKKLRTFGIASFFVGCAAMLAAIMTHGHVPVMLFSMAGMLGMLIALVLLISSLGFAGFTKMIGIPEFFARRLRHVDKLKFGLLNNLFVNRRKSSMKLLSKVFIKRMRWFSHERVYGDTDWKPRLMMNSLYDLSEEEVVKRKYKYDYLSAEIKDPGKKIPDVVRKSGRMGTTLWFTSKEMKSKLADSIIASGQFTICLNFIEYIEKFIKNVKYKKDYDKYSDEIKKEIDELHKGLLEDWKKFKEDPYWMVEEWKARSKG